MNPAYRPKRSTKRWLESAPDALLACYDNGGKSADRYTALYGAPLWDPVYGRNVPCRFMSTHPSHPMGVGIFADHPSHDRASLGRKVRFLDLPPDVQSCIRRDCSCDNCGKPYAEGKPCDCPNPG